MRLPRSRPERLDQPARRMAGYLKPIPEVNAGIEAMKSSLVFQNSELARYAGRGSLVLIASPFEASDIDRVESIINVINGSDRTTPHGVSGHVIANTSLEGQPTSQEVAGVALLLEEYKITTFSQNLDLDDQIDLFVANTAEDLQASVIEAITLTEMSTADSRQYLGHIAIAGAAALGDQMNLPTTVTEGDAYLLNAVQADGQHEWIPIYPR